MGTNRVDFLTILYRVKLRKRGFPVISVQEFGGSNTICTEICEFTGHMILASTRLQIFAQPWRLFVLQISLSLHVQTIDARITYLRLESENNCYKAC